MKKQTDITQGRLLIIDNNPVYVLKGMRAAKERGYGVDCAFDLSGAMDLLSSREYSGVVTDLQFYEKGIASRRDKFNHYFQNAEDMQLSEDEITILEEARRVGLAERGYLDSHFSDEVRNLRGNLFEKISPPDVISQFIQLSYDPNLKRFFHGSEGDQEKFLKSLRMDNMGEPSFGYDIIKYAQEENIPFAVVTALGHGQHCIPALFETGLVDVSTIGKHAAIQKVLNQKHKEMVKGLWDEHMAQGEQFDFLKASQEEYEEWQQSSNQRRNEIQEAEWSTPVMLFDKVVMLASRETKVKQDYHYAIDMVEGKIGQTRPYQVP